MNEKEILRCKLPGDLFTSGEKMEEEFNELALQWHPDKPGGSGDVMAHINIMHEAGKNLIAKGEWLASNRRIISLANKKLMSINFLKEKPFELGMQYICEAAALFVVKKEFINFLRFPKFKYAHKRMQEEFERYVPKIIATYDSSDGSKIVAIDKPDDVFSLSDILSYYKGKVPPRHVAWILSSMYNLCCFLKYNRITHNGMTIDSYYICPKLHSGILIGGWWYYTAHRERMSATPPEVYSVMPSDVKKSGHGSYRTDLECIKLIGRTLLGNSSGSSLYLDKDIPKPMINFLRSITSGHAVEDYKVWTDILQECFGPKKFIEMLIDKNDIYQ